MGGVDSAIYTTKQAMAMPEGFHHESSAFSFCQERGDGCSALSDMFTGPADILIQQPFSEVPEPSFGYATHYFPTLRNSKYAVPAQELLLEFCSAEGDRAGGTGRNLASRRNISGDVQPPVSPADRFECQRRRSKLLSMLDEVERRYGKYCEQMEVVVKWMDLVMGCGAAWSYTWQARKAMSRHFRSVKDGIRAQVRRTDEIMGDEERMAEMPRLSLIVQRLKQRRAFHQMAFHDNHHPAWRPHRCLPDRSVSLLRAWLFQHFLHPYPSDADKHLLARQTGLTRNQAQPLIKQGLPLRSSINALLKLQVSNWFINARVRLWKPMVEDMYQQEANEEETQRQPKEEEGETNSSHILSSAEASAQQQQQQQQSVTIPQNNSLSLTLGRFGP